MSDRHRDITSDSLASTTWSNYRDITPGLGNT